MYKDIFGSIRNEAEKRNLRERTIQLYCSDVSYFLRWIGKNVSGVTQTNAVKSPTDSPATTKLVYTVEEIARMLAISLRSAYNLCNSTTEFRVLRVGGSIRVPKDSFDAWLYRAA